MLSNQVITRNGPRCALLVGTLISTVTCLVLLVANDIWNSVTHQKKYVCFLFLQPSPPNVPICPFVIAGSFIAMILVMVVLIWTVHVIFAPVDFYTK